MSIFSLIARGFFFEPDFVPLVEPLSDLIDGHGVGDADPEEWDGDGGNHQRGELAHELLLWVRWG